MAKHRGRPKTILSPNEREGVLRKVAYGEDVQMSTGLFKRLFVDTGQVDMIPGPKTRGRGRAPNVPMITHKGLDFIRHNIENKSETSNQNEKSTKQQKYG